MTPTPPLIRPDFDSNSRSRRELLRDLAVKADLAGGYITISADDLFRLSAEKPPFRAASVNPSIRPFGKF